jgi:hypothetical protein
MGHIRIHHFAHAPGVTPCLGKPETGLNQMAKRIAAGARSIVLPVTSVRGGVTRVPGTDKPRQMMWMKMYWRPHESVVQASMTVTENQVLPTQIEG